MEDANIPPTQPFGALVPPTKVPGTAVATATPPPPPNHPASRTLRQTSLFRRLLGRTLDVVDEFADSVAAGLGLRQF